MVKNDEFKRIYQFLAVIVFVLTVYLFNDRLQKIEYLIQIHQNFFEEEVEVQELKKRFEFKGKDLLWQFEPPKESKKQRVEL